MDWMDFDRNGVIDGTDFFILNEIIDSPRKSEQYEDTFEDDELCEDEEDFW